MRKLIGFISRPNGRLFLCLISLLVAVRLEATGPALTTISDIVYRADGSAAGGTVVITWPNFSTADNKAVAAGQMNVTIGSGGVMVVALAPNAGSTPAGTYYKVVYKLDDGTTSTEFWVVPATGPTTIAAIRATVVPTQVGAQLASKQYVDSAVGGTVHIAGAESITGAKAFAVSPTAPDPTSASAVATKNYVDSAVGTGGGGGGTGYLPLSGGTMTGALFLWNDPSSATEAANRHYVDVQTTTLTGGIAQKLGREGDSPISLAGVRYADQFEGLSIGAQIDAACADLSGANGIVVIPSTLGAGWSKLGIPSNCTIYDFRGVGGSTQTAFARGTDFYGRYTQVGTGLQIVSPALFEFDAYAGGVNSWPGGAATKTQWQGIRLEGKGRTIGERKGMEINLSTPGKGDSIGIMASSYDFGGYNTGGDEGSEGGRFMTVQGDTSADGGFPRGTVASVSGNIVTGTWTAGTNTNLGEQRPLINTSRGAYNTGNIASVTGAGSPVVCTVNGSGTSWSSLGTGAKTDLFLEITGNSNGATKHVVPVSSITDDTHLIVDYSLAEIGATCYGASMTTSGAYNIYKGGMVASLASPPSGSLDASAVNLATGGSNFIAGDSIQQPLGYNYHGTGVLAAMSRLIGEPQGAGFYTDNTGSAAYRDAFRASGKFTNGISFDSGTLNFGVLFSSPATGGLLRSNDLTASSQVVYNLLNSGGTQRLLTYDRTNDIWQWSGNQYFSATDQRVGIGTTPQPNTLGYFYYNNSTWDGLIVAPNAAPSAGKAIFDTQVSGIPRLRVENARVVVNNASDLVGYSDDRATQKWKITGTDGTILGSTVNATSGFQVNGSPLNFTNIAGTLAVSAGGTGTTIATGTAGSVVLSNSPTIVTPSIASFANANHDHSNAAGGGQLSTTAVASSNKTGTGTKFATGTGSYTSGDCVKIDANGNLVDNGAACGGSGAFAAPSGWTSNGSVGAGNWSTAGNWNLDNTVTLTANGSGAANLWSGIATITPNATNDVQLDTYTMNVTGNATGGTVTWTDKYHRCNSNLNNAAGNLGHDFCDVVRMTATSTAGSTTGLVSSRYTSGGITNLNGATPQLELHHLEWDGAASGTGAIGQMSTINAGVPGAITGSPTVTSFSTVLVGDATANSVPGTSKASLAVGGPPAGKKVQAFFAACAGTCDNVIYAGGNSYFANAYIGSQSTLNGNFPTANYPAQVACSANECGLAIYQGSVAYAVGATSTNDFAVQNKGSARTELLIDHSTGINYLPNNRAFVTADFTTAANTNLQNITGLTFTLPASIAENVSFNCYLRYSQASAAAAVSFGISASVAPTQINASGEIYTSSSVFAAGNLQSLTTTTATAIITGTPSATATVFNANFRGMIENPSQAASTINIMVKTATSGDAVTVKRGSYCVLGG